MGQITGGSYGRTVNIGDYNSKKAEIAFSVDEGEDPEIFATQAVHLCHKILHTISAGAASRSDTRSEAVTTGSAVTAPAEAQPPKKKGGRPPKTGEPNLDPTDHRAPVVEAVPVSNAGSTTVDAATVIEDPTSAAPATISQAGAAGNPDPATISEDDLYAPAAPEITDVDLTKAVTKANTGAEALMAIRKLVGEFVQLPKKITDIPQGERQKFLDKLALLVR